MGFDVSKWHRTNLPNTAVGALVDDGTYKDPMMGTNLKSLPGMDYSTKHFFAIQDMPKDSPFICSWWWRTEFVAPADFAGKVQWLHLLGINYRANVWVNGKKIADAKDVAGTFVTFEFKVSKYWSPGREMRSRLRFSRRRRTTWGSPGSIGIRLRPTRTWEFGRKCCLYGGRRCVGSKSVCDEQAGERSTKPRR